MSNGLRTFLFGLALLGLCGFVFAGPGNDDLEGLKSRLPRVEGKEKVDLLLEIIELTDEQSPGDRKQLVKYCNEALKILDRFANPKKRVRLYNKLSKSYFLMGKNREALEYGRMSLALAEGNGDEEGAADALKCLGDVAQLQGNLQEALAYFERSSELNKKLNLVNRLADGLNSIASIHWQSGDLSRALDFLLKALNIYDDLENRNKIAVINCNIGLIYQSLKKWDESLAYFGEAINYYNSNEKGRDNRGIAVTLNNMAHVYQSQHKYQKSLEYFDRALKLSQEIGYKKLTPDILIGMGTTHLEMNDDAAARDYFVRGLALKEEVKEKKGISLALVRMAAISRRSGQPLKAVRQAEQALKNALESNAKEEAQASHLELSLAYEAMGNYRRALLHHKEYKAVTDSIMDKEIADRIANIQSGYEIEKKKKENELLKKEQKFQADIIVYLIVSVALALLLVFLIFGRYRLKSRSARDLKREIEERKLFEKKLQESEEKFRVLAEKSMVGIWIIQDNVIKYANPRALLIFELTMEEMIGKNPQDLVLEEDRPCVNHRIDGRVNGTENPLACEFRGRTKSGEIIHLESYGSVTQYGGEPAVLETIIDISIRKKVELELLKKRKLESIGILAGGIAHDFNNLLTIIIGNVSMAKMNLERERHIPQNQVLLENAENAIHQATDLAQKFITFSEGYWIAPKKVTLNTILKNTSELYPDLEGIRYDMAIPPDVHPLYGDERQLREVLVNLLMNADDATPVRDKKIVIEAENIVLGSENEYLLTEGDYVKISVIDNGTGIPTHQMEKIFDPYFTTKDTVTRKGLGLGLAICYSIVKKHAGHISVNSRIGTGTTINLYLPAFTGDEDHHRLYQRDDN